MMDSINNFIENNAFIIIGFLTMFYIGIIIIDYILEHKNDRH